MRGTRPELYNPENQFAFRSFGTDAIAATPTLQHPPPYFTIMDQKTPSQRIVAARPTLQPHELATARSCSSPEIPATTKSPKGKAYVCAMKALQNRIVLLELQNQSLNVQLKQKEKEFEEEKSRLNHRTVEEMAHAADVEKRAKEEVAAREGEGKSIKIEIAALRRENSELKQEIAGLAEKNADLRHQSERLYWEKERHVEQNAADREDWRKERLDIGNKFGREREILEAAERGRAEAAAEAGELRLKAAELRDLLNNLKGVYADELAVLRSGLEECRDGVKKLGVQRDTDISIIKTELDMRMRREQENIAQMMREEPEKKVNVAPDLAKRAKTRSRGSSTVVSARKKGKVAPMVSISKLNQEHKIVESRVMGLEKELGLLKRQYKKLIEKCKDPAAASSLKGELDRTLKMMEQKGDELLELKGRRAENS